MSPTNFLHPDEEQIRLQIQGVLDSYTHPWDLLSELAQNAVDSIREVNRPKGHFEVVIDAASNSISVSDNGVGIEESQIARLLRPFGTSKRGKPNQIGEKGVGITFVIFSSDEFSISTTSNGKACARRITGAKSWLLGNTGDLRLDEMAPPTNDFGTKVSAKISGDNALFDMTFEQILFALRTRTAFGDTGFIWGSDLNADVSFRHVDRGGQAEGNRV